MTTKHVSGTIKAEHIETLRKMAEQLSKNAENAERMCELLQPEFDKFEARAEPHNVYVVRDYVDHKNAAKRQRKEAEAILAAIQPDPEPQPDHIGDVNEMVEVAARVLLARPTAVNLLAQNYDREDAALIGEPDPWLVDDKDPDWEADRVSCARAALRALAGERG